MRTVKWMRDELEKFPDDALCYAYEGEVCGLVIRRKADEGVIFCGEGNISEQDSILLPVDQPLPVQP